MKKLTKKNLHLIGSAGNLDALRDLIIRHYYWSKVEVETSKTYESRLGEVYDVINGNGLCNNLVIIFGKSRWSLYRINDDAL